MKADGGPALPIGARAGMSLRDWFAAGVLPTMAGLIPVDVPPDDRARWCAEVCYQIADAMLAERAK